MQEGAQSRRLNSTTTENEQVHIRKYFHLYEVCTYRVTQFHDDNVDE